MTYFDVVYVTSKDVGTLLSFPFIFLMLTNSKQKFDFVTKKRTKTFKKLTIDLPIARGSYNRRGIASFRLFKAEYNTVNELREVKDNKALTTVLSTTIGDSFVEQ